MFRTLHEENAVTFAFNSRVAQIVGDAHVAQVVLDDGRALDADLVVIGVGVEPATKWLELDKHDDGSVSVDRSLRLGGDHGPVYAAGDLARYPRSHHGRTGPRRALAAGDAARADGGAQYGGARNPC